MYTSYTVHSREEIAIIIGKSRLFLEADPKLTPRRNVSMAKKFSLEDGVTCDKCVYWEELCKTLDGENTIGICHRFPPSVPPKARDITSDAATNCWGSPITLNCNACGEFITAD